jgi:co-chaperonin GroES (HSP10)
MKYLIALLTIIIVFNSYAQTEKFGREISLTEKTSISKILLAPEEYVGKTVLVEGEVLAVCEMAGCWMELKSDAKDQKIKIKVKDGDIVFPVEAKGKSAVVEGTVYKIDLTKEEAIEYYEHVATEQGTEFDPTTVTGPVTFYQIKGLGAEIK